MTTKASPKIEFRKKKREQVALVVLIAAAITMVIAILRF